MENFKVHDALNYSNDKEILDILKKEKLQYCDKITKINHFNISQERDIILTDKSLYNMKKKSVKRKIEFQFILGITLSKSTNEFVIHGSDDEYDYNYSSNDRNLIVAIIGKAYEIAIGKPLPISEIDEKSLKNYVTSKKEKEKYKEKGIDFTKMDSKYLIDTHQFLKEIDVAQGIRTMNVYSEEKPKLLRTVMFVSKHKTIKKVSLDDFQIIKVIARGKFGKILLVQHKNTKEFFAMKSLRKEIPSEPDGFDKAIINKNIINSLDYPFLVGLVFCFQTDERIYFLMNYINGGDLIQNLNTLKNIDEPTIRFYAALIGVTLEYLHSKGIAYRNLKSDSVLLDKDGYIKISEFSVSNILLNDHNSMIFCDSPEYLAPEVINLSDNKKVADWWTYGIILYEIAFGIPPFYSDKKDKILENINNSELRFPKKFIISDNFKDLLRKLLVKNPDNRLGAKEGFMEIKNHSFFKDYDFVELLKKNIPSPFKTRLSISTNK